MLQLIVRGIALTLWSQPAPDLLLFGAMMLVMRSLLPLILKGLAIIAPVVLLAYGLLLISLGLIKVAYRARL